MLGMSRTNSKGYSSVCGNTIYCANPCWMWGFLGTAEEVSRASAAVPQLCALLQAERRYESRLQDLKARLEQSESTNRSMQNYVQFLKSSYANVFADSALLGSPGRSRSSP